MNKLLGTAQLTGAQWGFAFLAAVVLLLGWEGGKWIARRGSPAGRAAGPALVTGAAPVSAPGTSSAGRGIYRR